jgi:hypothetical protein
LTVIRIALCLGICLVAAGCDRCGNINLNPLQQTDTPKTCHNTPAG